jgi:hypothetical protein
MWLQPWLDVQFGCSELAESTLLPSDVQPWIRSRICCICSIVISPVDPEYLSKRRLMDSIPTVAEQTPICQSMRITTIVNNHEAIYKQINKFSKYNILNSMIIGHFTFANKNTCKSSDDTI